MKKNIRQCDKIKKYQSNMSRQLTLVAKNEGTQESIKNNSLVVDVDVAVQSLLIKDMVEDLDEEELNETTEIPLPNVEFETLKKCVDYMKYHVTAKVAEIPKPLQGTLEEFLKSVKAEFELEFIKGLTNETIIEIIMAANYMNISDLLQLMCASIASQIKGKTPEQIRELFGIENDFTPEEEERIREENKWCEEGV